MINIENELFTLIANNIEKKFPNVFVSSKYINRPTKLPAVSIIETNNITNQSTLDSSNTENHAIVTYDINVYSKSQNSKTESEEIANVIDEQMISLGFNRIILQPMANIDDSVYRLVLRYTAVISQDKIIYRKGE